MSKFMLLCLLLLAPLFSHADEMLSYNRISFSVTAEQQVSNDRMQIVMRAQAKGADLQQLANEVNQTMDWALKTAKRESAVEVQTLNYQTSPTYHKGEQQGWQVTQSVSLSGSDVDVLSKLMGKLQSRLQTQSVSYLVSAGQLAQVQEKLTTAVLQQFSQRAAAITAAMQRTQYKLVEIAINSGGQHYPQPMLKGRNMMMAEAAIATPSFEAGSQTVQVSASGMIELSDQ